VSIEKKLLRYTEKCQNSENIAVAVYYFYWRQHDVYGMLCVVYPAKKHAWRGAITWCVAKTLLERLYVTQFVCLPAVHCSILAIRLIFSLFQTFGRVLITVDASEMEAACCETRLQNRAGPSVAWFNTF